MTGPPLGRRFKLGDADSDNPYLSVVGLVGDVREEGVESAPRPLFYLPHGQRTDRVRSLTLVVRTEGPPEELAGPVRALVADLDPLQPVHEVSTFGRIRLESLGAKPLATTLLIAFATITLLLALVGLFAMVAYTVSRHSREIGIRMFFCLLGALGTYLPARRAARVDPAVTLRRG